jgi:hypothetical protein
MPVPRQEFGDAPSRVVGDPVEDVGEVMLRINAVELGGLDQRVHRCGAPAAGVGAGEEPVLAADGDTAQGAFGRVVVGRQAAIIEAADKRSPTCPHIAERGSELGFARQLRHGFVGPGGQRVAIGSDRCCRSRRRWSGGKPLIVSSMP